MYDIMDQNNFYTNVIFGITIYAVFSIGVQTVGQMMLSHKNPTSSGHAVMSNNKPQSVST